MLSGANSYRPKVGLQRKALEYTVIVWTVGGFVAGMYRHCLSCVSVSTCILEKKSRKGVT